MPFISQSIPNLINGVSQQAPSLRLATQAEEQINGYSTVANGLMKRPPRMLKKVLSHAFTTGAYVHTMNRTPEEKYQMFIENGDLKVYDVLTGNERTVSFPNGKGYLAHTGNARDVFRAKTIADYTVITNGQVSTALAGTVEPTQTPRALVNIAEGNYARWYKIFLNGVEVAAFRTPDGGDVTHADGVVQSNIAAALAYGSDATHYAGNGSFNKNLTANAPAPFAFNVYGNVIEIYTTNGADFSISTQDSYSEQAMYAIKDEVSTFQDLPDHGPDGFTVKVIGGQSTADDDYYVKLSMASPTDGHGVWKECPAPGVKTAFNAASMPHVLISEADGTFTFKQATYDQRVAGDETTMPPPSFVGFPIKEVTFYRNRLSFLSADKFVSSRSGDLFNFWRTTATELLDDDPIDVFATDDHVSLFNYAVPWLRDLFLFSIQAQFDLSADKLLTPKTVSIDAATYFDSSALCSPVPLGNYLYFSSEDNQHSLLSEYFLADNVNETFDRNVITNHVPHYVPSNLIKIAASSVQNLLVALSANDRQHLYIYKFYWSGKEKLQASWSKWEIEANASIVWVEIMNDLAYLTVNYEDGKTALETIPLSPSYKDEDRAFTALLDRRVDHGQIVTTYSAATDKTTCTLPYSTTNEVQCVSADGTLMTVSNHSGTTFELNGDQTAAAFYAGIPYVFSYTLSPFYYRVGKAGGGTEVKTEGRLQMKTMSFTFGESSYFRVEVTPRGRQKYTYEFSGYISGEADSIYGTLPISSGVFAVPLIATADGLKVEVINDTPFASNLLSAEWRAMYIPKRKRA